MSLHSVSTGSGTREFRPETYHIFQAYGIELEYMLVDRGSLDIVPAVDEVFKLYHGSTDDVDLGDITISNELVRHVMEFKSTLPVEDLHQLGNRMHQEIRSFMAKASTRGWTLLPGGMHPWMNPDEMQLWPFGESDIYSAYNRIFDCRGHGWSNLQSMHLNLPFAGEEEFGRLHAAVRVVLPLLPAIAASSPIADGRDTGFDDYRLHVYKQNQQKVPAICGEVIPEPCFSFRSYQEQILQPMFEGIKPFDTEEILQEEWLNSRGAIARFDRNAIEIRLIDVQECPKADMAIAFLVTETIRALAGGMLSGPDEQRLADQSMLVGILDKTIRDGGKAVIDERPFLQLLGLPGKSYSALQVWQNIFDRIMFSGKESSHTALLSILEHGTLSSRIRQVLGQQVTRESLLTVYAKLSDCLYRNELFLP